MNTKNSYSFFSWFATKILQVFALLLDMTTVSSETRNYLQLTVPNMILRFNKPFTETTTLMQSYKPVNTSLVFHLMWQQPFKRKLFYWGWECRVFQNICWIFLMVCLCKMLSHTFIAHFTTKKERKKSNRKRKWKNKKEKEIKSYA